MDAAVKKLPAIDAFLWIMICLLLFVFAIKLWIV